MFKVSETVETITGEYGTLIEIKEGYNGELIYLVFTPSHPNGLWFVADELRK
jgi:hypothetical protein